MSRLLSSLALSFLFLLVGCSQPHIERVEWPVMGTVAAVQWKEDGSEHKAEVAAVRETFAEIERLLNAHDPSSELSRLAALPDEDVLARCDSLVRPCYEAAFALRDETGGVFNPRWRGPRTMDLGGIAKGFAVDLAAQRLVAVSPHADFLIDLGGNLKAVKGSWTTAVAEPESSGGQTTFELTAPAACATSAEYYRGHHIKDGRSGASVSNAVYSVTVIHPDSATLADGLSTVLFILGREKGEEHLKSRHPEARAVWLEAGR